MKINGFEIRKDITGKKFGMLTAIKPVGRDKYHKTIWEFQCDCGNSIDRISADVVNGSIKSCGCASNTFRANAHIKDLTGQTFGYLKPYKRLSKQDKNGNYYWLCECLACGNPSFEVISASLLSGNTKTCGCTKSLGEKEIINLLTQNQIRYKKEYCFDTLVSDTGTQLKYDFYLIDYHRLIEFDGEQHFISQMHGWNDEQSFKRREQHDKMKNEYALQNNIPLVRIPYWERGKITLDMILKDKYLVRGKQNE